MKDPKQTEVYKDYIGFMETANKIEEECKKIKIIASAHIDDNSNIITDYEWRRAKDSMNEFLYYLVSKQNEIMAKSLEEAKLISE